MDRLPAAHRLPEFRFDLPELRYPNYLNCAEWLVGKMRSEVNSGRIAVVSEAQRWTYGELAQQVDRLTAFLRVDLQLVPGNRVLLRGHNSPMLIALWLAVVRAGGIVVATMPMLRSSELTTIIEKASIEIAFCELELMTELDFARTVQPRLRTVIAYGNDEAEGWLPATGKGRAAPETLSSDPCLIAFTSGTTGAPKAAVHLHRDVLSIGHTFSRHILGLSAEDRVLCTAPLGFTFGLGFELVFPLLAGAAVIFPRSSSPEAVAQAIEREEVTCLATAPTAYRKLADAADSHDFSSLRTCVSAGEGLSAATWQEWHQRTGITLIDGIGATEMLHIFVSARRDDIRPGATGRAVPGYIATLLDNAGRQIEGPGVGRLAVKGPTGCRYLDDPRQSEYVQQGWNVTGDIYSRDADGYLWFQARCDDMIVSSGYNIAGPEVEGALLQHPGVKECAVIGQPDVQRGHIVAAFVITADDYAPSPLLSQELQTFVKGVLAPYKYPRHVEFVSHLPKSNTGKIRRAELRKMNHR
jgi:2-aminobenzoate-CoA ligase